MIDPIESEHENRSAFLAQFGSKMTGTRIHFVPDATIFETTTFDYDVLAHRMRELAFLNAGLTITITGRAAPVIRLPIVMPVDLLNL